MTKFSLPPLREMPPERLREIKQHLLAEIRIGAVPARPQLKTAGAPARLLALIGTTAIVAAVAAFFLTHASTPSASAASVRAQLATGLPFKETVRGELAVQTRNPGPRPRGVPGCLNCTTFVPLPARFTIAPDGSYSTITLPVDASPGLALAYDAKTDVETSVGLFRDAQSRRLYIRASHPDPTGTLNVTAGHNPLEELARRVLGALAEQNPHVQTAQFTGRSAWELTLLFTPGTGLYDTFGRRLDVVVDQQTGLVLQLRQYAYSVQRWTALATVTHLEIGGSSAPSDFTVAKPADAVEVDYDYGFRDVVAADVEARVGYRPLLPKTTLGRRLSELAVSEKTTFPVPGGNAPVFKDVVSARYGDGPGQITVTTWRGRVFDLADLGGSTVHLKGGALIGDNTNLDQSQVGGAAVNGFHKGLIVRVSAPSAQQALTIATSLRAVGG